MISALKVSAGDYYFGSKSDPRCRCDYYGYGIPIQILLEAVSA